MRELIDDLHAYNDWANHKILLMCNGLTDAQLDLPRALGFGSLRATLFHILTAEVIWLERWQATPWRAFPTDPAGMSLAEIADRLHDTARQRRSLIDAHRQQRWRTEIEFQDSKKTPFKQRLADLLLHVVHHGVHHRAQALHYLKHFGRTAVAGIDYIFYRLATASAGQSDEALESLTAYGLEVGGSDENAVTWDLVMSQRLFDYHDWANGRILQFASGQSDVALDRDFAMGPGSIRKTLLHLYDAERWWLQTWTTGPQPFPHSPEQTPLDQLAGDWTQLAGRRNAFLAGIDADGAQRVVEVLAGGPPTRFRVGESAVHLAVHGTHHRAQLINMLRQTQAPWQNIDLLYALDALPAPVQGLE